MLEEEFEERMQQVYRDGKSEAQLHSSHDGYA
jgi:hypothetical protein